MNKFEAEYFEARKAWHGSDGSMTARSTVAAASRRIARAANKAGAELDEISLDEQARKAAHS